MAVTIRDRLFVKKILRFLGELESITDQERDELLREMREDKKYEQRVGETLILILDQCDDFEKPRFIAKLFRSFLRGEIDYDQYQRLALAINHAYIQDLKDLLAYFARSTEDDGKSARSPWERLYPVGLARIMVHPTMTIQVPRDKPGSTNPFSEQQVRYTYSHDAETLAKIMLGEAYS